MSESKTIRISVDIHKRLKLMAVEAGITMQKLIERFLKQDEATGIPIKKYSREDLETLIQKEKTDMREHPAVLKKIDKIIARAKAK